MAQKGPLDSLLKRVQSAYNGGVNVNNNVDIKYVKSGEFGTNLVEERLEQMNDRGTKGKVIINPLKVSYIQTDVLPILN
ncbi:hypothetical protein CW304_29335 [Bacillus sp. UFRGS-B20]|nr:hypothetical protein CW304_29335 [Bacillus sp. UFRGS-B20]